MKKVLFIISALFLIASFAPDAVEAQTKKQIKKTRKAMLAKRKQYRKIIKDKAVKQARKEAKRLEKEEGWRVFPGDMPLDKALEKAWTFQYEEKPAPDGTMGPAYIWATGNGVAKTKSAAKMQAIELAKVELAGQLKTHVTSLTTSNIANAQLSGVDAETEQSIVQTAKSLASATLKNLKPTIVLYRTKIPRKELRKNNRQQLSAGAVEVQAMLFYDLYQADFQSRDAIKQELKDKLKDNQEELKKIMDL